MPPVALISLLMGLSNALTRIFPVWLLSGRQISPILSVWLKNVPVPVLSAMLACDLFLVEGKLDLSSTNLYPWVALPCFWVAYRFRSLFITVIFGMGLLACLRALI